MTAPDNKVLLAEVWERTSARGNKYLSGFLGKARLIGFQGEPREDGTPTWRLYVVPGNDERRTGAERPGRAAVERATEMQQPPRAADVLDDEIPF